MKLTATVALAFMLSAAPMPAPADDARERAHNQCGSRVLDMENGIWCRAFTTYRNGNDFVVPTLDRPATDCSNQFISMNIVANKPSLTLYPFHPHPSAMQIAARACCKDSGDKWPKRAATTFIFKVYTFVVRR